MTCSHDGHSTWCYVIGRKVRYLLCLARLSMSIKIGWVNHEWGDLDEIGNNIIFPIFLEDLF